MSDNTSNTERIVAEVNPIIKRKLKYMVTMSEERETMQSIVSDLINEEFEKRGYKTSYVTGEES